VKLPITALLIDTSWWPCASRLAMRFTRAGWDISAVYPRRGHPLAKTSGIRRRFPYRATDPLGSLARAIESVDPDVIVPSDDRAVGHLHQLHASASGAGASGTRICSLIERSLGSPASYPVVASRFNLIACAREEGIRTPDTRLLPEAGDSIQGMQGLMPPWVLKADGSWGGHGVRIAHNREQAERFLAELAHPLSTARFLKRLIANRDPYWFQAWRHQYQPAVVVQSHIVGRPANCAVACWNGELLAGLAVEVIAAQGVTGSATVVRAVEGSEMILAASRLARRLSLSGFFGLDFMIEDGTRDLYLIEMNPRCTPLSHLSLGPRRDLVAALNSRLEGDETPDSPAVTQNDTIAYFPQAWHWDPDSNLLKTSFCDVPSEEPELVKELLRTPWPDRSILARLTNQFRGLRFEDRASARGGVFETMGAFKQDDRVERPR
jgi:ATP-grasp domain